MDGTQNVDYVNKTWNTRTPITERLSSGKTLSQETENMSIEYNINVKIIARWLRDAIGIWWQQRCRFAQRKISKSMVMSNMITMGINTRKHVPQYNQINKIHVAVHATDITQHVCMILLCA